MPHQLANQPVELSFTQTVVEIFALGIKTKIERSAVKPRFGKGLGIKMSAHHFG